jgi:hypothetical protein
MSRRGYVTGPSDIPAARAARNIATSSSPKAHSLTRGLTAAPDHLVDAIYDSHDGNMVRAATCDSMRHTLLGYKQIPLAGLMNTRPRFFAYPNGVSAQINQAVGCVT